MNLAVSLQAILLRDLTTLRMELEAYPSDADLWRLVPGISNSGGTLALHLTGNLRHFIGAVLGQTGYARDRDAEFASRDTSRSALLEQVEATIAELGATLPRLSAADLDRAYPLAVAKVRVTTGEFLLHLATHFTYHLGQLDYHRRMATGGGPVGGALSPARLASAVPEA